MTVRTRLRTAKPRRIIAERIAVSEGYAHKIAEDGMPVGSTKKLAFIAHTLGLTPEEIGLSVLEWFPTLESCSSANAQE